MKTLKEELQDCLAEMKACQAETEKLLNDPRITWPKINDDIRTGDVCEVIGNDTPKLRHYYNIGSMVKVIDINFHIAECKDIFGKEQSVHFNDLKKIIR